MATTEMRNKRGRSHKPTIKVLESKQEIERAIEKSATLGSPLVIKYYASWCEPCKIIAPWYEDFAQKNQDYARFASMNVDLDDDAARYYKIKSIPAFHIWLSGNFLGSFGRQQTDVVASIIASHNARERTVLNESAQLNAGYLGDDEKKSPRPAFPQHLQLLKPERSPADEIARDLDNAFSALEIPAKNVDNLGPELSPLPDPKRQKMCEARD